MSAVFSHMDRNRRAVLHCDTPQNTGGAGVAEPESCVFVLYRAVFRRVYNRPVLFYEYGGENKESTLLLPDAIAAIVKAAV